MFLLLPIGNTDAKVRRLPWVTLTIIGLCLLVQLWGTFVGLRAIQFRAQNISMDPGALADAIDAIQAYHPIKVFGYAPGEHNVLRLLPAAFVHGGWMHLLGNMFFLYTVGCNIEDRWGRGPFAAVYLVGIFVSGLTWASFHSDSMVPLIGASGAVSALMGAFIVYFLHSRICFFWFFWYFIRMATGSFSWPAWAAIGLWITLQLGMAYLETQSTCISVAYTAHVGGFVFGLVTGVAVRLSGVDQKLNRAQQELFDGDGDVVVHEADPRVLEATGLLATRPLEALALFGAVMRDKPSDDAVRNLIDALEVHADGPSFDRESLPVFAYARAQRNAKLANAATRIGVQRGASMPLSDVDWAYVVASARECADPEVVVFATGKLMAQHPGSRYIPKAMFETAMAQREAHKPELAQKTLARLVAEYPSSLFADRARSELKG